MANAEALDQNAYTPDSWAEVAKAVDSAKEVLAVRNPNQRNMDRAMTALQRAVAQLELKPAYVPGDVDGDGKVTSTDARLTLQLSVGKIRETDVENPAAADVDGQEGVTSTDARLILQKSVGKIDKFPVE